MEKCTRALGAVISVLIAILIIAAIPTEKEGAIYEDTLRLHILANSDSKADQNIKIEIRDRLLEKYGVLLSGKTDKSDAESTIIAYKSDMERDVDEWLQEAGVSYGSEITLGTEWYERREYGDIALPEGYYTSVRVRLGSSEGQNWWCVMYPPLCLDVACEDADADDALIGYQDEEARLITSGRYTVKFKILELVSDFLR